MAKKSETPTISKEKKVKSEKRSKKQNIPDKVAEMKDTKSKATEARSVKKNQSPSAQPLKGISDIRRFFYKNETPIYFVSATNFNLLGADEWVKSFKFICYIECFDGKHPNVFSPKEMPHEEFQSIEDINNYLLEHKEVSDYIKSRGKGKKNGKVLYLMFDERTEKLAKQLGLEVCFPPSKLRQHLDNKVTTTRVAERAGVPSVPNVLAKVESYEELGQVSKKLGKDLVIQTPFGDSGHTTFFISNEKEWDKYKDDIVGEKEVKIMKRIRPKGAAIEACVTRNGTIVAPLMTELVGFKELTPYKGGWCGNEIYNDAFTKTIRDKARQYTQKFGEELKKEGYKGYFELDFLIDQDTGKLYLGELNPRITGASSITNHAVFALADCPLFLFHLLEWMDVDYKMPVKQINSRWSKPENIDSWSQLVIKHTEDTIDLITNAPKSGIWKMKKDGSLQYSRMDTHRRAVESESEAFFLRISKEGDYRYEGADLGILVTRGRLMTDDFQLNKRAKAWINGIRSFYEAKAPADIEAIEQTLESSGGFKML